MAPIRGRTPQKGAADELLEALVGRQGRPGMATTEFVRRHPWPGDRHRIRRIRENCSRPVVPPGDRATRRVMKRDWGVAEGGGTGEVSGGKSGCHRRGDNLHIASRDSQIPAQRLRDDDAVERVLMFPRKPARQDRVGRFDRQLRGAHVGHDVRPRRQQRFAIETSEASLDRDLPGRRGRDPQIRLGAAEAVSADGAT